MKKRDPYPLPRQKTYETVARLTDDEARTLWATDLDEFDKRSLTYVLKLVRKQFKGRSILEDLESVGKVVFYDCRKRLVKQPDFWPDDYPEYLGGAVMHACLALVADTDAPLNQVVSPEQTPEKHWQHRIAPGSPEAHHLARSEKQRGEGTDARFATEIAAGDGPLADEYREILEMLSQGYSQAEISELLGKPASTIQSRVTRMRETLEESGYTWSW